MAKSVVGLGFATLIALAGPATAATVTVQRGDTLSTIAQRALGDEDRWPEICAANSVLDGNCDYLAVGMTLEIPGDTPQAVEDQPATSSDAQVAEQPADEVEPPSASGEPVDLAAAEWTAGNATGVTSVTAEFPKVENSGNMFRSAVFDPSTREWIVPATDYAAGAATVSFTTNDSGKVRIYPLRGADQSWVFTALDLDPNTAYLASWTASATEGVYTVTDFAIRAQ